MLAQLIQGLFGQDYLTWFTDGVTGAPIPLLPNGDDYYNRNYSRDFQLAAFGEATYAITPKLKATAGLRYAKVNVAFDHYSTGAQNFGTNVNSGSEHESPFTPKLSLSYQANQGNMYYATYAKGYRIGGANPSVPLTPCQTDFNNLNMPSGAPASYTSDTVNSYELGAKNRFGNVRVASSVYWIRWNNIQQNVYLPGCGFQFTTNQGEAVAKGADAQIEWAPFDYLNFETSIGYTQARYAEDVAGGIIAKKGDAVVGESGTPTPPWTISVGGQYDFLALDRKSFVRMDIAYQSHNSSLTATEDQATAQYSQYAYNPKSYTTVSMRAGTTFNKWNVSAFIDNLLNTHPDIPPSSYPYSDADKLNTINPPSSLVRTYTLTPRTIGITATYHY